MDDHMSVGRQFQLRAAAVPTLGLGLSVDVYSPDLFDLMTRFEGRASTPSYLEIFRATPTALRAVREHLPAMPLAYHGEGLWITQPGFSAGSLVDEELNEVASHLNVLASPWLNHECATKQMGGYSFGTYLPPLYTVESAKLVAANIALVQERLDQTRRPGEAFGPLFLLEMAPLTYFMAGTISVAQYFRLIADLTPCGFVLDIGHLWTVYRYSADRRRSSLEEFIGEFLDAFPMERVTEIHIAGLAAHEAAASSEAADSEWIDAHHAPIPAVSWALLARVLGHPRLQNLRGLALEVDTKSAEVIVEEFGEAAALVGRTVDRLLDKTRACDSVWESLEVGSSAHAAVIDRGSLEAEYVRYALVASGRQPPAGPAWKAVAENPSGLERYIHVYLPHEILRWGGDLRDMFPITCSRLGQRGVSLDDFVPWWFHKPRPADGRYDFFLMKIDRLLEFVAEREPGLLAQARREAEELRLAYEEASAGGRQVWESSR
jgi:uncharacterized protein (UPF0276 family)